MRENPPHRYIAVDGPICVGKSTVAGMLAKDLGAKLITEPKGKNPFLGEFYKDRKKNAFKTQLFFLLERYQQQEGLRKQNFFESAAVCDYTFAKDMIFAGINLSEDEKNLYGTIYDLLHARIVNPDIVIYLQANAGVLLERIRRRDVAYEKAISADYLEALINGYNNYFFQYSATPLLIVNCNDYDIIQNPSDWEALKQAILAHKKGTAHYHYVGK